jgi:hypothetical protein
MKQKNPENKAAGNARSLVFGVSQFDFREVPKMEKSDIN